MKLPADLTMHNILMGHGAKGMAVHVARNDEFGVEQEAVREHHGASWVLTFTADLLPSQSFSSYAALCKAFNATDKLMRPYTPQALRVEARPEGKYAGTGGCWLCHDGVWKWNVRAKLGWRDRDEAQVPSCEACLEKVKADPAAAVAARRTWVKEHPSPLLPSGAFARLRTLKYRDYLNAKASCPDEASAQEIQVALILISLTIDGRTLAEAELMDTDLRDAMAISREFNKLIAGPIT